MELLRLVLAHPFTSAIVLVTAYVVGVAVYRLWLSPIASFPGPRLAALTSLYEFYYDTICCGQFTFHIGRLHEKYGPIVRIGPDELHVNDPDFYEVLYARETPRNKYEYYQRPFGAPCAVINAIEHSRHRLLRSHMNPFFSTARIRQQEPALRALLDKLCRRLEEWKETGRPVNIEYPYTCFTTDVITDYTMGDGYHYLDEPDFIPAWSHTMMGTAKTLVFFRPIAWVLPVLFAMPERLTAWLNPGMELFFAFQRRCRTMIRDITTDYRQKVDTEKVNSGNRQKTFFHDILGSSLPEEAKSAERLAQEMQILVSAGAETTAKAMSYITFYLLNDPPIMEKLMDELNTLDPERNASLVQLEQMPYLVCLIPHPEKGLLADEDRTELCWKDSGRTIVISRRRVSTNRIDCRTGCLHGCHGLHRTTPSNSKTGPFRPEYATFPRVFVVANIRRPL